MVSFGTNQGPIVPREQPQALAPRNIVARSPAPVSENVEDTPNPYVYKPLVPLQYRTKLLSFKPSKIIFGTAVDQTYTPSNNRFDFYSKQGRTLGVDYTGPHVFDRQDYEIFDAKKAKTTLKPSVSYNKPYYQQGERRQDQGKVVPQIGVVYSAGVRYYVPQVTYYDQEEHENSVYDQNDQKDNYRQKGQ